MADISNSTLGVLIGVAFLVSVAGLYSIQTGNSIFGFGTTGKVYVNISSIVSVNVTRDVVDFGNSSLKNGATTCSLDTELVTRQVPVNCWYQTTPPTSFTNSIGGLQFMNAGNRKINVTVTGTKAVNGSNFFDVPTAAAQYLFRCPVVTAGGTNGTAKTTTYTHINVSPQRCIDYLDSATARRGETVHINITIPSSAAGLKSDTITFTASRSCAATC